jgi:hypothetical protein
MPRLSDLTDYNYDPTGNPTQALPVEEPFPGLKKVHITGEEKLPVKLSDEPKPIVELPSDNIIQKLIKTLSETQLSPGGEGFNRVFGVEGDRIQLWPEKLIRSGATAAGDIATGKVPQWSIDKDTGDVHTSPQMIEKAQEMSALAGTGGLAGTGKAKLATKDLEKVNTNPLPKEFARGTKDDTGIWFLEGDKPIYAQAKRDSLDKLYGDRAKEFDNFNSVSDVNSKGQPISVWYREGHKETALKEVDNFKKKVDASTDAEKAKLHYESGVNLGYPEEAARAYAYKRFGIDPSPGGEFSLGIVPVDIAKKLKFKSGKPNDVLKQAVDNTPAATIDADGHLIVKIGRNQHPDQEMSESVRGGVFYLPEGSKNARHYNGTTGNNYGGRQSIEGETAFVNPLVVKGATGGKAPEMAYTQIMGKDAFKALEKEIHDITTAGIYKKESPWMKQELTQKFLEKHAPELVNHADYIIENSAKGNQLRYALQEAAIASAARNAGHDGIVGYSVGRGANKDKPFLSEIFDVRENRYPSPSGDFSVHPELYSDSSKPAAAIQANKGPFLRPALKYKDKLYKGKEGQQHMDVIPESMYPDFQKKAMSGGDIAEYNFGFINDKGHFLSREKALQYGIDNGIIDPQAGKFGALTSTMAADSSKPGVAIEARKDLPPSYELKPVDFNPFELKT